MTSPDLPIRQYKVCEAGKQNMFASEQGFTPFSMFSFYFVGGGGWGQHNEWNGVGNVKMNTKIHGPQDFHR